MPADRSSTSTTTTTTEVAARLPAPNLGLTWKPITLDDIDDWLVLVQAIEAADRPSERYDRDDLVEELTEGSHRDPARHTLLGRDTGGVARAFGHLNPLPGALLHRVHLWGGVHPQCRGRGIGRELLRWQTERANELVAEKQQSAGPAAQPLPWRIAVSHQERLTDRNALCEAAGYTAIRWFHDMVRPLTGPGATPVPELVVPGGLEVAPWTGELDEAVRRAHNESFAGHWGSQPRSEEAWHNWTVGHRTFRRHWSHLVLDRTVQDADGLPEVAGYVVSHTYPQDWEAQGYSLGWIALLGVRPGWRSRGLAPALLAAAMRSYAAEGIEAAGLDVDTGNTSGALDLYTGMGFRVEHTSVAWALESPDARGR